MKKTILSAITMLLVITAIGQDYSNEDSATYNNKDVNEKKLIAYTASTFDDKFSGFVSVYGAVTPSHDLRGYIGLSAGFVYKYGEISVSAFPGVTGTNPTHFFNAMVGYRFTINKLYTFTPRLGLYVRAKDEGVLWKDGNHAVYGGEITRAVANNLHISCVFYDYRHKQGSKVTKLVAFGVKYSF